MALAVTGVRLVYAVVYVLVYVSDKMHHRHTPNVLLGVISEVVVMLIYTVSGILTWRVGRNRLDTKYAPAAVELRDEEAEHR